MHKIVKPPKRAVEPGGKVNFGYFESDFAELNLLDAPLYGWRIEPKALRRLRLKEWQHICMITETHWISLAIVNAQFMNVTWCYAFDRRNGKLTEHKHNARPGAACVPRELWNDCCSIFLKGYGIRIHNNLTQKQHIIEIDIEAAGDLPSFKGRIVAHEDSEKIKPLIPVLPMKKGRIFYTHKVPTPIEGELKVGDERIEFDPERHYALFDIHKVFYPARTYWNWATFAGPDKKGDLLGLNVTHGTAFPEDSEYSESCLWYRDTICILGSAHFDVPQNTLDPWSLRTLDERCEMEFKPEGQRAESIRIGPIVSEYYQPFGKFKGYLVDDHGKRHEVDGLFGCTEKHTSTW